MAHHDFDAARAERAREREPLTFALGGETFACAGVPPLGVALDLYHAEAGGGAGVLDAYIEFVRAILVDADHDRFDAVLRRRDDPIDVHTLIEVVRWLGQQYTARPTTRSNGSSDGAQTSGEPSSTEPSSPDIHEDSPS